MLKVAAYARVSTDSSDQINSLKNQIKYFCDYIKSNPEWEYAGIYYDNGVTGTQTKKRDGFNKMINDCYDKKIDLIVTKEVSRFARNTVDTLEYTRLLNSMGIGILFINDNIDTRANDGEFRLSIMASVAQEESRKISERVKWGQKRAMESGIVFGSTVFGYTIKNGKLYIKEDEAEIVKNIFYKYTIEGKGTYTIAKELTQKGIKPPKSKAWSSTMVLRILKNEKYAGDLIQRKTITENYLTHKRVRNENDKVFIPAHHKAIIDADMWQKTQAEIEKRKKTGGYTGRNSLSGKLQCSLCGENMVIGRKQRKNSDEYIFWHCRKCSAVINHKIIKAVMKEILCKYNTDKIIKKLVLEIAEYSEEEHIRKKTEEQLYSECVYGEILDNIKVSKNCLSVFLNNAQAYKIEYETKGYKENYSVNIKKLEEIRTHNGNTAGIALRMANSSRIR